MRKLLPYIFIIFVLIGTFGPADSVWAADSLGTCTIIHETNSNNETSSQPNLTEKECAAKASPTEGISVRWQSNPTYTLLSPLPCEAESSPGCIDGQLKNFDPTGAGGGNLGKYLNIMIRIFIGICAVLAVMMIVVGGIEYMTSELMSTKEQGRHKISGAIFGLLLALGAWTLLNQINPDLLNTELKSLTTQTVTVELMDDTETLTEAYTQSALPTTAVAGCPGKMAKTKNGIVVCDSILANLEAMIAAAQKENLSLTGYGYRHAENQRQKRIKNCNGDTTNRGAKCVPPTALPGFSRHNAGLAVDFRCSAQPINTRDNICFKWLQANASKYRFYNLPSEPWHWSIDGR